MKSDKFSVEIEEILDGGVLVGARGLLAVFVEAEEAQPAASCLCGPGLELVGIH